MPAKRPASEATGDARGRIVSCLCSARAHPTLTALVLLVQVDRFDWLTESLALPRLQAAVSDTDRWY